jgi:hypothetical protein
MSEYCDNFVREDFFHAENRRTESLNRERLFLMWENRGARSMNKRTKTSLLRLALVVALTTALLAPAPAFATAHLQITGPSSYDLDGKPGKYLKLTPASFYIVQIDVSGLSHPVSSLKEMRARFKVKSDNPKIAKVGYIDFMKVHSGESPSSKDALIYVMLQAEAKRGRVNIRITDTKRDFPEEVFTVVIKENVARVQFGHNRIVNHPDNYVRMKPKQSASLRLYAIGKAYDVPGYPMKSASPQPSPVAASKVKWKSSNKKVATVNKSGKVTIRKGAKKGQTATITGTYKHKKARFKVKVVKREDNVFHQEINDVRLPLIVGQKGFIGTQNLWPFKGRAFTKKLAWRSSAPKVLTVDSRGYIKAKKPGEVTVTVKYGKILFQKIRVRVMSPGEALTGETEKERDW